MVHRKKLRRVMKPLSKMKQQFHLNRLQKLYEAQTELKSNKKKIDVTRLSMFSDSFRNND